MFEFHDGFKVRLKGKVTCNPFDNQNKWTMLLFKERKHPQ